MTEQDVFNGIIDAMKVQDFIWGSQNLSKDNYWDAVAWPQVFQKRVDKIASISQSNPSWKIELRKRLLQQAALSVQAMLLLDRI